MIIDALKVSCAACHRERRGCPIRGWAARLACSSCTSRRAPFGHPLLQRKIRDDKEVSNAIAGGFAGEPGRLPLALAAARPPPSLLRP